MFVAFFVIDFLLIAAGFVLGLWWRSIHCTKEIEEAYYRGYNNGCDSNLK